MSAEELIKEIVKPGLCTACGTCVGVCPERCLSFDPVAETPAISGDCVDCGYCVSVCPGKDIPIPELEKAIFGRERESREGYIGVHRSLKMGQSCDEEIRKKGASGGIISALLCHAFEAGIIDAAVVTAMDPKEPWIARPQLVTSAKGVIRAVQSKYILVPVNSVLTEIEERDLKRVAVVGLPCHMHGLRKLMLEPGLKELEGRIAFTIGIFCSTNYSRKVVEHFITEFFKVSLDEVHSFQYRGGANNQEVILTTKDGRRMKTTQANRIYLMTGHKKERCLVCADLYSDLADISVGDVFTLDDHKAIPNLSSIIVRSERGEEILASAEKALKVRYVDAQPDIFYGNIGFERKLHGAAYRIKERREFGWPVPDFGRPLLFEPQRIAPYQVDTEQLN